MTSSREKYFTVPCRHHGRFLEVVHGSCGVVLAMVEDKDRCALVLPV